MSTVGERANSNSPRRGRYWLETWAFAWLASLTIWNLVSGGQFRNALLFAIPVIVVARRGLVQGFLFAGLAALAACFGAALPSGPAADPIWISGFWAFLRLSVLTLCIQGVQHLTRSG